MKNKFHVALTLLTAGAAAAPAAAQVTLKVADSLPTGHYIAEAQTLPWMEEVTAATDGEVQFEYYPAEQLGKSKDMLALVQSGVADIAYVVPSFVPEKMPLSPVAELPIDAAIGCPGAMAYYRLMQTDSTIRKVDYDANGLHPLFVGYLPPYQVFTNRKISSLDELQGMKVRVSGSAKTAVIESLGGIPVQIPTPEVREAFSRGTVDGILFVYSSLFPYDLAGLVETATTGVNFGGWVSTYAISQEAWDQLSPKAQEAMTRISEKYTRAGCESVMENDEKDRQRLVQEEGVELLEPKGAEKAAFQEKTNKVSEEWAAELDAHGRQGSAALAEFRAALDEN